MKLQRFKVVVEVDVVIGSDYTMALSEASETVQKAAIGMVREVGGNGRVIANLGAVTAREVEVVS